MTRTLSSLPHAPAHLVREVADDLVRHGATLPRPPSLRPAMQAAVLAIAASPIGSVQPMYRDRIRRALEDVGVAVMHTLARFKEEDPDEDRH